MRAWGRLGLSYQGLPTVLAGGPFSGIHVDPFDTDMARIAIQQLLVEKGVLTELELDEKFRELKYTRMQKMREENEAKVKEMKTRAALGLNPNQPILGPDGRPIQ